MAASYALNMYHQQIYILQNTKGAMIVRPHSKQRRRRSVKAKITGGNNLPNDQKGETAKGEIRN
eukprot:c26982_g1_i5 orf=1-189(-)